MAPVQNAHVREDQHDGRELEEQADQEHHRGEQGNVGIEGNRILDRIAYLVVHEEHQAHREDNKVADGNSQVKKEGRHPESLPDRFLLIVIQGRRNELPDLVYNVRESDHDGHEDGHFQMDEELRGYVDVDQFHREIESEPPVQDKILRRGPENGFEELLRDGQEYDGDQGNGKH